MRWGQGNRGVMCQPQARWENRFGAQSCQPAQAQALPSLNHWNSMRKGLGRVRREKAGRISRAGSHLCMGGWGWGSRGHHTGSG